VIAVTGATGGIGGRVAQRLSQRGVAQRLVVRDPARAPQLAHAEVSPACTYDDATAMAEALAGAETLLFVSAGEAADRMALHRTAIEAALDAGVTRIVYVSFLAAAPDATFTFARDHWATEEHIRSTGVPHTFLRDSQYLDFVPRLCGSDGVIRGPAGDGEIAWVARDHIADVATAVLLASDGSHDRQTYDLTGGAAHTLHWAADQLEAATGRPIRYEQETVAQAYASRAGQGEDFEVAGWVSSYEAIATGEMNVVSDAVARIAGHAPQSLPEFLGRNPESWAHLRA
jgi:NAD(P)H dehydrogenase (quinone)